MCFKLVIEDLVENSKIAQEQLKKMEFQQAQLQQLFLNRSSLGSEVYFSSTPTRLILGSCRILDKKNR